MKVVFILPGFPRTPGGGHAVVYRYAAELSARGHMVDVLHLRPARASDSSAPRLRRATIRTSYILARYRRPSWFKLPRDVRTRNFGTMDPRHVTNGADVIIATSARTAPLVADVTQQRNSGGAYLIQHYETFSDPVDFVNATWRLPLLNIVVSEWLVGLADELGASAVLLRNPVDVTEFPSGNDAASRAPSIIAMVSPIAWKRTDLVCRVYSRLSVMSPGVRLSAFGVGARPRGLPETVEYVRQPTRNQLSSLYRQHRIFLCTSDSEGFGLPAAEAAASGTLIVSTENGGVRDVVGGSGLFSAIGDAEGLLRSIVRSLKDEQLTSDLARQAQDYVRSWSWEDAVVQLERLLHEAVRRGQ